MTGGPEPDCSFALWMCEIDVERLKYTTWQVVLLLVALGWSIALNVFNL